MSGPLEPSTVHDTAALERWLEKALNVSDLRIESTGGAPLNGASNDTLMLRASWLCDDARDSGGFVVRRPPSGPGLYQHYDLSSQYATMKALAATEIPVPPLVGLESDPAVLGAPFYVMHEVPGEAPPDLPPHTQVGWVLELPPREQAALYEASIATLARIHALDHTRLPLGHLPGASGGFAAQLADAEAWYRWARGDRPNPVLDAALAWLHEQRPTSGENTLNWGDARIGNLMYVDLQPVAVLDWEMAAIGPPEVDLGWWLFLNRFHTEGMGNPQLPGFPDDAATVALWERASGRTAENVVYYDVFGGFRFAIIVLRAARRMVELGQLPPDQSFERDNGATQLLARMLDVPAPS